MVKRIPSIPSLLWDKRNSHWSSTTPTQINYDAMTTDAKWLARSGSRRNCVLIVSAEEQRFGVGNIMN